MVFIMIPPTPLHACITYMHASSLPFPNRLPPRVCPPLTPWISLPLAHAPCWVVGKQNVFSDSCQPGRQAGTRLDTVAVQVSWTFAIWTGVVRSDPSNLFHNTPSRIERLQRNVGMLVGILKFFKIKIKIENTVLFQPTHTHSKCCLKPVCDHFLVVNVLNLRFLLSIIFYYFIFSTL